MPGIVLPKYLKEIAKPDLPAQRGQVSWAVKRVQEWLCYHGFWTGIDRDFGLATEAAVKAFQKARGIGDPREPSGVVDEQTWNSMSLPLLRATAVPSFGVEAYGDAILRVARMYYNEGAREVGGDNLGMWQRHFARGRENQPWCQDFATTVYMDAARNVGIEELPFDLCDANKVPSSWVPWVANSALRAGKLRLGKDERPVPGGSMFFLKGERYFHVGIVTADKGSHFETIEGNSNAAGSANGNAVVARYRARSTADFAVWN